jgi:hypothetical protein
MLGKDKVSEFSDSSAWVIQEIESKKIVGRVITRATKGGTLHLTLNFWDTTDPDLKFSGATGSAGGYGYDKLSSALEEALTKLKAQGKIEVKSASGNQESAFKKAGYDLNRIL